MDDGYTSSHCMTEGKQIYLNTASSLKRRRRRAPREKKSLCKTPGEPKARKSNGPTQSTASKERAPRLPDGAAGGRREAFESKDGNLLPNTPPARRVLTRSTVLDGAVSASEGLVGLIWKA